MSKQTIWPWLICGVITGLLFAGLFKSCGLAEDKSPEPVIRADSLENAASEKEEQYRLQIDSISGLVMARESKLKTLQGELRTAKNRYQALQTTVVELARAKSDTTDSTMVYAAADSLKQQTLHLAEAAQEKDSLYESVIGNQQQLLQYKDSVAGLQQRQYLSLKHSFYQSLVQQQLLEHQQKQLQKLYRRQQFKNKLLTGLTLVVAGFTVNHLVHH